MNNIYENAIKSTIMVMLLGDITKKKYSRIRVIMEYIDTTNRKLCQKRGIMTYGDIETCIYYDMALVITDSAIENDEVIELVKKLYATEYSRAERFYEELVDKDIDEKKWVIRKDTSLSGHERALFRLNIYTNDKMRDLFGALFVDGDSANYLEWIRTDEDYLGKTIASEAKFTGSNNSIFDSKLFERYLKKRREDIANYYRVPVSKIADAMMGEIKNIVFDKQYAHNVSYLVYLTYRKITANHGASDSWINFLLTKYDKFNTVYGYVVDVDKIIDDYYFMKVHVEYSTRLTNGNDFTELTLARECVSPNIQNDITEILYMIFMDCMQKINDIFVEQYYQNFSWEKIDGKEVEIKYKKIVEEYKNKNARLKDKIQRQEESRLEVNEIVRNKVASITRKQLRNVESLNKTIENQQKEIEKLKKLLASKEEFINELQNVTEELDEDVNLDIIKDKRFLVVGHVSERMPELKKLLSASIFMETENFELKGIQVEGIIFIISFMSHSMFYKVKASSIYDKVMNIKCNGKKAETVLMEIANAVQL